MSDVKLKRDVYESLIREDLLWLAGTPANPEREHIRAIVERSLLHEYAVPTPTQGGEIIADLERRLAESERAGAAVGATARAYIDEHAGRCCHSDTPCASGPPLGAALASPSVGRGYLAPAEVARVREIAICMRDPTKNHFTLASIDDLLAILDGAEKGAVVHVAPRIHSGLTECCGRSPIGLPTTDRMVVEAKHATCRGAEKP